MRRFILHRKEDATGMSGTGAVAYGVEFNNGMVVLSWDSKFTSVSTFTSISVVEQLHSHNGKDDTEVLWVDNKHLTPKQLLDIANDLLELKADELQEKKSERVKEDLNEQESENSEKSE